MTQLEALGGLLVDGSVWRMKALAAQGITAATVRRAVAAGVVEQVSRGTYRVTGARRDGDDLLAELVARVPAAVVCLNSAAYVHGLGDVAPSRVWLALPRTRRTPDLWPPARYVRWTRPKWFEVGVEQRLVAGVQVRLTGPARTVVDMLEHQDLVGEDRAHQCLRDYIALHSTADLVETALSLGAKSRTVRHLRGLAALGGPR